MVGIEQRERVVQRLIEEEMRESFLDYSMSVIVQRALPDVRDGLKPVHRRILYAMSELGLGPTRPYKKSASVVGEVLGKYHPHGDMAVYDALVRMVQDFSLRYPLVDGQGNFGSIDGDNAAAYRYTEVRLTRLATEMLADIDKDTVDFSETFDNQRREPDVLPSSLPNLLINGSAGIAVGMSTNVPPHNVREVAAALHHLVAHPDCGVADLMREVPGPDFPTGGLIIGRDGIREAYDTGRGRIAVRARAHREVRRDGREQLVVTELPYGVSKTRVVEQIAELARSRKLEHVADLRDESDRDGMRIVIELKRDAKPKDVMRYLCRHTYLQATFGAILLALDHGAPREFNLKQLLERFRDHRLDVIRRRSRHDLEDASRELHIAEGLLTALDNIDAVIALIRGARDRQAAAAGLRQRFELTEAQADAILDMRLARLTALERSELEARMATLRQRIADLEQLLADDERQRAVLLAELDAIVERYGDARRTGIIEARGQYDLPDLVAQEEWVVTASHEGYVKRMPVALYRKRLDRGKPLAGMEHYESDFVEHVFLATSRQTILVFTASGRVHSLGVLDVPESARSSRGRALRQILSLGDDDAAVGPLPIADFVADRFVVFVTAGGMVKRTPLDQFANARAGGIVALGLRRNDSLFSVQLTGGSAELLLATRRGRAIRFPESEIPVMGRTARGVKGIALRGGDRVVAVLAPRRDAALCLISEAGFIRRLPVADLPLQRRGGLGSTVLKVTARTGAVITGRTLLPGEDLVLVGEGGVPTRIAADQLPEPTAPAAPVPAVGTGNAIAAAHISRAAADGGQQLDLMDGSP
jgi:DNA gyrase subunit A